MARSGDGFLRCSDGQHRWGLFGAAGVLFVCDADGDDRVMLQKRSAFAHEGGTWSCAGGALDEGEEPLAGALREATEEIGEVPAGYQVLGKTVFAPADDWSYATYVVRVSTMFGSSLNFETDDVAWDLLSAVTSRRLHPGFAAAWPELVAIISSAS